MPARKKAAAANKSALSKAVQPDALAAVAGKDPLPRTELTKKDLGVHLQTRAPGSQG
jgi:hypothetical protein